MISIAVSDCQLHVQSCQRGLYQATASDIHFPHLELEFDAYGLHCWLCPRDGLWYHSTTAKLPTISSAAN